MTSFQRALLRTSAEARASNEMGRAGMNAADRRRQRARHLLIVDDDDRIRELLKEYLARAGFRVTGGGRRRAGAQAAGDPRLRPGGAST